MSTATASFRINLFGETLTWDQSVTADGGEPRKPDMIAAQVSTDFANTGGVATLPESHGILTADTVDVYWIDTAGIQQYRYGCTVGTVDGTSVPMTGGTGTALPADDTVVTVCKQIPMALVFVGNSLKFAYATATDASLLILTLDNAAKVVYLLSQTSGMIWFSGIGSANPFAGRSVASATVSTSKSTGTGTINPITAGYVWDTTT